MVRVMVRGLGLLQPPTRLVHDRRAARTDVHIHPTPPHTQQEKASLLPVLALDLQPGQSILDLCGAPGSKTTQILEKIELLEKGHGEKCLLVVNEYQKSRAKKLAGRLWRHPCSHTLLTCTDARFFPSMMRLPEGRDFPTKLKFDRVLADVPCSGDGTYRKDANGWSKWDPKNGLLLHSHQLAILSRGLDLLDKNGTMLVYSTCSLNPIENEAVVAAALIVFKGSVRLEVPDVPKIEWEEGISRWKVPDPNWMENGILYSEYDQVPDSSRPRGAAYQGDPERGAPHHKPFCCTSQKKVISSSG